MTDTYDMSGFSVADTEENKEKDVLGFGGPLQSGVYTTTIKMAYMLTSSGGAKGIALDLQTETGAYHNETIYITSGTAKGGKNYYVSKSGEKVVLPGMQRIDSLAKLTTGDSFGKQLIEKKSIEVYDFDQKARIVKDMPVVTSLLGKVLKVGILNKRSNKNIQGDNGKWGPSPTNEDRVFSEIDRVFNEVGQTTTELAAGADASFINQWSDKYSGKLQDEFKPQAGTPTLAAATPKAASSLFPPKTG